LWEIPTGSLAREMIAGGLRAKLACVDKKQLQNSFAGRDFDVALLSDLPPEVDPCGERGEFHTCVYDGPMFTAPVNLEAGEIVDRMVCVRGFHRPPRASQWELMFFDWQIHGSELMSKIQFLLKTKCLC